MSEKRVVEFKIQELDATILALEKMGVPHERKQLIQYLNDETIVLDLRNAYRKMKSTLGNAKSRQKIEGSTDVQRETEEQSRAAVLERKLKASYNRNEEVAFQLNSLVKAVRDAKALVEKNQLKEAYETLSMAEFEYDDANE